MRILTFLFVLVLTSFVPIWSAKKHPSTTTSLPGHGLRMAWDIPILEMAGDALGDFSSRLKSRKGKLLLFAVREK